MGTKDQNKLVAGGQRFSSFVQVPALTGQLVFAICAVLVAEDTATVVFTLLPATSVW
jgi:hypothetical protein